MSNGQNPSEKLVEIENREWIDSLDYVLEHEGRERVVEIFERLHTRAQEYGVTFTYPGNTPYLNTIGSDDETPFPGNRDIERRIKSLIRWNAMAMVTRANKKNDGIGGHISTYASAATLFEVAFNHFLRGPDAEGGADFVYFQGHASPGVYARSYLEGRLSEEDLEHFRRELPPNNGLSSYPHPRSMPDYWQFPTVSMGLAPIMAIYQARFNRYLVDNGVNEPTDQKVWAFLGDGEMDEPESKGALTLASREELDNLIFVVDCNLQRLDGPVRGNHQVIQELEAAFRGAGWNVIKVIWGSDWDPLLERDTTGKLAQRMSNLLDGQAQLYTVSDGAFIREDFFGVDDDLLELVESYSDEQLAKMRRGGHDPIKVYNAYNSAVNHRGSPTVILAQTVKGYGLGEAGEGKNITHKQKKLNEEELKAFRSRFSIPLSDDAIPEAPFYRPDEDTEEMGYLKKRRDQLGGWIPQRRTKAEPVDLPDDGVFSQYFDGSGERTVATTMAYVQLLSDLVDDENVGERIVPIVPDEARTFGMESMFRSAGIYSHVGQLYEPVDRESLLYYREAKDGKILEEGITEAGSISSFIAAGTSYSTHGTTMIPFFTFYSMFGFQRVGDLIWAAGDARARGFLVGGTSGRSSLPGEGLQHADGQSHAYAYAVPSIRAYDPTFAYELAVIVREGMRRMFVDNEDLIYYITVMNEKYPMPAMPDGVEEGILRGLYRYRRSKKSAKNRVRLLGSGTILNEALRAADILEENHDVAADVYSATSYKALYDDAAAADRFNMLHPNGDRRTPYVSEVLADELVTVAACDYLKSVPLSVANWVPGPFIPLGADGYGRSDIRESMRRHFELDGECIALAALDGLRRQGHLKASTVEKARSSLGIDSDKPVPTDL